METKKEDTGCYARCLPEGRKCAITAQVFQFRSILCYLSFLFNQLSVEIGGVKWKTKMIL